MHIEKYETIPWAWYNTNKICLRYGRQYTIQRGSYKGQKRKQLDMLAFEITETWTRPLATTFKGVPISDDESIMRYFEDYLIGNCIAVNEQYTYGSRVAPHFFKIIDMLKCTPYTNQAVLNVGKPEDVELDDPPCLRVIDWKVTDGKKLQLTSYWRSWDLFSALPMNLGGLQLLNEFIAEAAELPCGSLVCYSSGGHVYDHNWGILSE